MKMRSFVQCVSCACLFAAGLGFPASATVLYSDGAINGTLNAFPIYTGSRVADSFTLTHAATLTSVTFGSWVIGKSPITRLSWSILAAPSSNSVGKTAIVTSTYLRDQGGWGIASDSFSLGSVTLKAGTYFLELTDAKVADGSNAYWDESGGPSVAWDNGSYLRGGGYHSMCTTAYCSESFQIFGSFNNQATNRASVFSSTGVVPEPAAWALMFMGFGAIGGFLRGARRRTAGTA